MPFEILCEIDPPGRPGLGQLFEQVDALAAVSDAFLVPDSHLGRATVSSVAIAGELRRAGSRAIPCLNARDRNLLGLQRDLLTAATYALDEVLLVYGDEPSRGERTGLTVREMLLEIDDGSYPIRPGVAIDTARPLPAWKRNAGFLCAQIGSNPSGLLDWRDRNGFDGPIYVGVMVLASVEMARRLMRLVPGFHVPGAVLDRLARHPSAGVDVAVEQVLALRETDVAGVHLVPARRFQEVADALSARGLTRMTTDRGGPVPAVA